VLRPCLKGLSVPGKKQKPITAVETVVKEALKLRVKDAEVAGLPDIALHVIDTHLVPSFIESSGIL